MRSNVKVGRGVIVRKALFSSVAKGKPTFSEAAAETARLRDEANKASAAASAARFRQSLIAKGLVTPTA